MKKTALIIIDVQQCFMNEHTKDVPMRIVEHLREHTYAAVYLTKFVNNPNSPFARTLGWRECMSAPDTDLHPALAHLAHVVPILERTHYSVFKGTDLETHLRSEHITHVALCGMETDACVLASAFEAFDLGFSVEVLPDLCATRAGTDVHDSALRVITRNVGATSS